MLKHISGAAYRAETDVGREIIAIAKDHKRVLRQFGPRQPSDGAHSQRQFADEHGFINHWLYGDQIHWDPQKAAVLEAWPSGLLYQPLVSLLNHYAREYWNLGDLARRTADMPAAAPPTQRIRPQRSAAAQWSREPS